MHYYIECCLLQGLTLDETAVALQHLGVQERLTRISKLSVVVACEPTLRRDSIRHILCQNL